MLVLTPAEARRLHYVREKLHEATSAYQHDRLIDALAEIYAESRRLQDADQSAIDRTII